MDILLTWNDNQSVQTTSMIDDEEDDYTMNECDEDDDYPMKECRGTEPRLALLQLFSIGKTTSLDDEAIPKLSSCSRSLSAPALFNNVQELCDSNQGHTSKGKIGELPLTDFDRYRMMIQQSPSLASVDTEHHSNTVNHDNPETIYLLSNFSRNIAQREFDKSREMDTNRVRNRNSGGVAAITSCDDNYVPNVPSLDSRASNNTKLLRYPLNTTAAGKSLWYAQHHQETTGRDISIYDTTTAPGEVGVLIPNVLTANRHRPVVYFTPLTSSSTSNFIKVPLARTPVESFTERRNFETNKYIPSNFRRVNLASAVASSREQVNDGELQRLHTTESFIPDKYCPRLSTMPGATARRGPPSETEDAVRYGVAYNQSNGRVPVRPQHSNPNETQRNPPSVGGMNGVVEGDLNPPLHNDLALQQPTPLFERLVTEEVQELRAYVRIVENQNRRLIELERVHGDLEVRLEIESKSRQQLEATLEAREREWAERLEHVERDRDNWKALVEAEKIKNSKLLDQVYRKDQDIHRMLQRKVRRCMVTFQEVSTHYDAINHPHVFLSCV